MVRNRHRHDHGLAVANLLYHRIACPPAGATNPDNYVCPGRFNAHMKALAPQAPVVTIDGSYADAMAGAEILERYDLHGIFFVIPKKVGTPGRLTWAQVRDLHDRGHTIGNLTWSHPDTIVGITPAQLDWQIEQAQDRLTLEGVASPTFAYPWGLYDQPAIDYLAAHGFTSAYSVGIVDPETPLTLSRLKVEGDVTSADLVATLAAIA